MPRAIQTFSLKTPSDSVEDALFAVMGLLLILLVISGLKQTSLVTEVSRTTTESQELSQEVSRLSGTLTSRDETISGLKSEQRTLQKRLEETAAQKQAAEEKLSALEAEAKRLKSSLSDNLDEADQRVAALSSELTASQKAIADLRAAQAVALAAEQEKLGEREGRIDDLQTQIRTLEREVDILQRDNRSLDQRLTYGDRQRQVFLEGLNETFITTPTARTVEELFVFQSDLIFGPTIGVTGSTSLTAEGRNALRLVIEQFQKIRETPQRLVLAVRVHTHPFELRDVLDVPTPYESTLAMAQELNQFLFLQGLEPWQVAVMPMGDEVPLDDRGDEFAARRNTRVDVTLIEAAALVPN